MKVRQFDPKTKKMSFLDIGKYPMLPTDRRDINSKMVYDGDVLREIVTEYVYYLWVVRFGWFLDDSNGIEGHGFYLKRFERITNNGMGDKKSRGYKTISIVIKDLSKLKITGNIYENKSLFIQYFRNENKRDQTLEFRKYFKKVRKSVSPLSELDNVDYRQIARERRELEEESEQGI